MRRGARLVASGLVLLAAATWANTTAWATYNAEAPITFPDRPGDRDFIADQANIIDPGDEGRIRQLCDATLSDVAVPIIVVTIESMVAQGADGWSIERYAQTLFDEWGIGYQEWNHGILLLVSVGDRKARIELGADWRGTRNAETARIMNDYIIPRFKEGDYSGGVVLGVTALDKMARGLELPKQPRPTWHYCAVAGFIGLLIFTVVSLIRRGASGWAWAFWALVFVVMFFILKAAMSSRSSGGSFGGGSFGGGSSGGGGATGSW